MPTGPINIGNKFEILGTLGRGASGIVFRARSREGREVAVKLLLRQHKEGLERFKREQRIHAVLAPEQGFVPLLETGETRDGPYLVMPFMAGGTLRQRLDRGVLPLDEALSLGRSLAGAMGRAHVLGIVHRDLKPENVLFDARGVALVADLGLGKFFDTEQAAKSMAQSLSRTGELRGTLGYMAPEQIDNAKVAGPPADVFAIGAILYECLTGRTPIEGENPFDVLQHYRSLAVPKVASLRPDVPAKLAKVIDRAISMDASARFEDGHSLLAALGDDAPSLPVKRPSAKKRVLAGVALLTLTPAVGLMSAGIFKLRHPRGVKATTPSPSPVVSPKKNATPAPSVQPTLLASPIYQPAPAPPDCCKGFLKTKHTRLAAVLGSYRGKDAGPVLAVSFSSDGRVVYSAGGDRLVRARDARTGDDLFVLAGAKKDVLSFAFTKDGKHAVATSVDGTIFAWDISPENVASDARPLMGPRGTCYACAIDPDGARAFSGANDGLLWVQDPARGLGTACRVHQGRAITGIALLPEQRAITSSADGTLAIVDLIKGAPVTFLTGSEGVVYAVSASADGKRALSGGQDKRVRLWDLTSGKLAATLEGHGDAVTSVAISRDGKLGVSASSDRTARVWDLSSGVLLRTLMHDEAVRACAISPEGKRVVTGSVDQTVRLWDLDTGDEVWRLEGHAGPARSVVVSLDGTRAISGGARTLKVWDLIRSVELSSLEGHTDAVCACSISTDGKRALSASHDRSIREWDLDEKRSLARLEGHTNFVYRALFSPDNQRALSTSYDGTLRLWDLSTGAELWQVQAHGQPVYSAAVSRDWTRAVTASQDSTLKVWKIDEHGATEERALKGSTGAVRAVAFLPDQVHVVSSGEDGVVRVWDASDAASSEPVRLEGHSGMVFSVAVADTGALAVSTGQDGTLRLWDMKAALSGRALELDTVDLASSTDFAGSVAFAPGGGMFMASTSRGVLLRFVLGE